jgi:amidase
MFAESADPFVALDATAQAELVRRGEVTPLELVDAAIARIERLNPSFNAVVTPLFDQARAQAVAGLPDGPFRGVPFLLKDYFCTTAGDPYYEGMRFLRDLDWRAPGDSYLAAKFRATGFVFLGKTNLPELAALPITESSAFGATRNPWDPTRSPGGSSGGSAAAVAVGMVPVAHGNDGTGSLRIPASACGLVGLKPSRGRTSAGPARAPGLLGNVVEHVLTRTVRDAAAILDCVAGPMPGDLFVAPPPVRPFRDEVGVDPGRLRIGLLPHDPFLECPIDPQVLAAVRATGGLLESLGHVVDVSAPLALSGPTGLGPATLGTIAASGTAAALDAWSERTGRPIGPDDVEPHIWARAEEGRRISGVQIHAALRRLAAGVMRAPEWWATGFDLLLTPTMQQLPPKIGQVPLDRLGEVFGLFSMPFSITGQPAVSLPLGWSDEGLPVGVQFVADYGREDVLIRLAAQLEVARPWADRWPPGIHASASALPIAAVA